MRYVLGPEPATMQLALKFFNHSGHQSYHSHQHITYSTGDQDCTHTHTHTTHPHNLTYGSHHHVWAQRCPHYRGYII